MSDDLTRFEGLDAALKQAPSRRGVLEKLTEAGLSGAFGKYLVGASAEVWLTFLSEAERLDFDHLARHRSALKAPAAAQSDEHVLRPMKPRADQAAHEREDEERGREALRAGRWGVVVFAGGAGTRFISEWPKLASAVSSPNERLKGAPPDKNAPKGVFPISPVVGLSFYQLIAAHLLDTAIRSGRMPWLLLMTSRLTHDQTAEWLDRDSVWGLPKERVILFRQGEIPRLDPEGDLIVQPDGRLFWTGNGHGGVYAALAGSGTLARLRGEGVRHLIMGNVDNAALKPLLPARLGCHERMESLFTMSVSRRRDAFEKVGVPCVRLDNGRVEVIEYSVLRPEVAQAAAPDGGLLFDAAHLNVNLVALDAVDAEVPGTLYLDKPVEVAGRRVLSSTYEMLNQHLALKLPPERVHLWEGRREEVFLPTKAIVGVDSVETTVRSLIEADRRIVRESGVAVSDDALVELHPALGTRPDEIRAKGVDSRLTLDSGSRFHLGVRHGIGGEPLFLGAFRLGSRAAFIVTAEFPYGPPEFDSGAGTIRETPGSAGRLRVGRGVEIEAGASAVFHIEGNGLLEIADGVRLKGSCALRVRSGEHRVIRGSEGI